MTHIQEAGHACLLCMLQTFLVLSLVSRSSKTGLWLVQSPSADHHLPGPGLKLVTAKETAQVFLPVLFICKLQVQGQPLAIEDLQNQRAHVEDLPRLLGGCCMACWALFVASRYYARDGWGAYIIWGTAKTQCKHPSYHEHSSC